jgi:choline dehydrogenase-like flavoprotein
MRPVDARTLEDGRALEAGLCIVGAGAAGITLALALERRCRDILLVEAGAALPEPETQALHDVLSVGHPFRPSYISRARWLGGSCNLWAGRSMRLTAADLAGRPWVPRSAWPIPYAELARWYPAAGEMLALPPPAAFLAETYAQSFGPVERALLADPRLAPTVSLWAKGPMRFALTYRRRLEQSPGLRILLNANAAGLDLDPSGRSVARLRLATLDGRRLGVRARHVVLAAGGIENARLLLLPGEQHPDGIGNAHGHVGRCFMEHPRAVFGRALLEHGALSHLCARPLAKGRMQLGLALSAAEQARRGLLNHYLTLEPEVSGYTAEAYASTVDILKVLMRRGHVGRRTDFSSFGRGRVEGFVYQLSPKEILPQWAFVLHDRLRRLLPQPRGPRRFAVVTFCEQPPEPSSRVTLGARRDALGLPQASVDWRIPAEVDRSLHALHGTLGAVLAERGLGRLEPGEPDRLAYSDASHHMGTTRMSAAPTDGVVDPDCRVHGVENLWIAGSSVFPSAGHANPTLTIVALALRLAERLAAA